MSQDQLQFLHKEVQNIIDAMAVKEYKTANNKLVVITEIIEELIDTTTDDRLLIEFSKYQIVLQHLQKKLNQSE
ncbi:hypothetical protein [Flavobacterium sp. NRK F7]|uniref:hypothetical protein n=1 Tax=Flavobacterium sp. NRK F7 TaxID=2954930 RepID=UPI002090FC7D|nr:hypothetical protein [Flavobacterium sp. NRK F7]MCO6163722.1 hypothetical protein [Flavobacterium sp. NRK F7]